MNIIHREIGELIKDLQDLDRNIESISNAAEAIMESLKRGRKVLTCGNGGSASDALHLAEELIGKYRSPRKPYPAICLCADTTALTCIGNDFGFDEIFSRQVEALAQPQDIVVGFSTSGKSQNVLKALETGRRKGSHTILLTGNHSDLPDYISTVVSVPSLNTARIQEMHTLVLHIWLELIETRLGEESSSI